MNRLGKILLVEDDHRDVELTMLALRECRLVNEVVEVNDGSDALDFLFCRGAFEDRDPENPAVVLLDLKMPKVGGLQVLKEIRESQDLKRIPIVILTSSRQETDLIRSYDLGVNAYVVKPVEFGEFMEAVKQLGIFWAIINEPPPRG
ncbi:MAG: response regulator [Bacteroidetes bacterium]|nr:response regulator [Bacteroidota bacterium]MCL5034916.1 response regulator [Bacteroidota bacterium]